MKTLMHQSLRAALALLLLAGLWQLVTGRGLLEALPQRLLAGAALAAGLAAFFMFLLQRVCSEDRIARLEAELCREQNARSQADEALAEADQLLTRLTARGPWRVSPSERATPQQELGVQLAHVQAELAQIQQQAALDPACAARLERARNRLEQVARTVRGPARGAAPGQVRSG